MGVLVQVKGPRTLCYATADAAAARAGDAFQTFCFLSIYLGGEEANRTLGLGREGLGATGEELTLLPLQRLSCQIFRLQSLPSRNAIAAERRT